MRIAVIGGGWAGLSAAVEATRIGHAVTLFEMSGSLGGRARSVRTSQGAFDNGQHILIGAYARTLGLMKLVGVDVDAALCRTPLQVLYPDGSGLKMAGGPPVVAFLKAVAGYRGWSVGERLSLVAAATRWSMTGFRCQTAWTVARLTRGMSALVRSEFIDPLCVAALNTPSDKASATVFLRVLKDALFSGPGSADLLLPRSGLEDLLPGPAASWLSSHGAVLKAGARAGLLSARENEGRAGWDVDGEAFDVVIVACTAAEAARLVRPISPAWAVAAASLQYEPIVTVYAHAEGLRLPAPMLALRSDAEHPAQFVFDHGQLSGRPGLMALVVSGASDWLARGLPAIGAAALAQLAALHPGSTVTLLQTLSEKRATFLCTPGLARPGMDIAPGLCGAGDYIDGPYPATLEGAVRSGHAAAERVADPGKFRITKT